MLSAPQTQDHRFPEPDRTESPASILPNRFSRPDASAHLRELLLIELSGLAAAEQMVGWRTGHFRSRTHSVPTTPSHSRVDLQIACRCSKAGWGRRSLEKRRTARPRTPTSGRCRVPSRDSRNATCRLSRMEWKCWRLPSGGRADGVNKSVLSIAEPRRYRNKEHLRFVVQQPVSCAGERHRIPITSASCNRVRLVGR